MRLGETASYGIRLAEGEFLHLTVDQVELDAVLHLYDPDGELVGEEVDYFYDSEIEEIFHVAEKAGTYRVEVSKYTSQGDDDNPRLFRVSYSSAPQATADQRVTADAFWKFTRGVNLNYNVHRQDEALKVLQESIDLWEQVDNPGFLMISKLELAVSLRRLGRPHEARQELRNALAIQTGAKPARRATAISILGMVESRLGLFRSATRHQTAALRAFQDLNHDVQIGNTLVSLCGLKGGLGLFDEGEGYCRAALEHAQHQNNRVLEAKARGGLGWVLSLAGRYEEAEEVLRAALALAETGAAEEALASGNLGRTLVGMGRTREAIPLFERAKEIRAATNATHSLVHAQLTLTRAFLSEGRLDDARAEIESALESSKSLEEDLTTAQALEVRARVLLAVGEWEGAHGDIEEAFKLIESVRPNAPDPRSRGSLFALKWRIYEFRIEVAMHRDAPPEVVAQVSLEAAEQARARTLVDMLVHSEDPLDSASFEEVLSPVEIQQQVLREDTALLQFFLGTSRSFAWRLTKEKIEVFELPPREQINQSTLLLVKDLTRRERGAPSSPNPGYPARASGLSQMLRLPEAISGLAEKRLLIVPDGSLHQIPFSVLPTQATDDSDLLIDHFEIVYAPSATVLAKQREAMGQGRTKAESRDLLAIVADPVLDSSDRRLNAKPSGECDGFSELQRLPQTREEAQAIAELAPDGAELFLGFEADKALIASGRLSSFKYLHFASHGVIDLQNSDETGLALSCYDEKGGLLDGRLTLYDIQHLKLNADMVVLSACRTAQGENLFGEGLIGLTRGFMNAGAPRVIASLWTVQDSVTRELMQDFYTRLLSEQKRPAQALREAQLALRQYRPEPYHWAAFVFQGEWQ